MMTREQYLDRLRQERAAFETMLPELMQEHSGKVAVLQSGVIRGTFANYGEAYAFAVETFGLEEPFLIEPITLPRVETISVAWDAGVMFA